MLLITELYKNAIYNKTKTERLAEVWGLLTSFYIFL